MYKKLIAVMLITLSATCLLFPIYSSADLSPENLCELINVDSKKAIVCKSPSSPNKLEFFRSFWELKRYDENDNKLYEVWNLSKSSANFKGQTFSLIVINDSPGSYSNLKIKYTARALSGNFRILANAEKQTIELRPKNNTGEWKNNESLARYYKVNVSGWPDLKIQNPSDWEDSMSDEAKNKLKTLKNFADHTKGLLLAIIDNTNIPASREEINYCFNKAVGLLSDNQSEKDKLMAEILTGFKERIAEYEKREDKVQENIDRLKRLLQKNTDKPFPLSKEKDMELFRRYYHNSTPQTYSRVHPNVVIDQNLLMEFGKTITQGSTESALAGYDPPDVFGSQLWDHFIMISNTIRVIDSIETQIVSSYSYYYIKKNLEFRKCVKEKFPNSEYAQYSDGLLQQLESLITSTYSNYDSYAQEEYGGVCDKEIQEGNSFLKTIKKAICALFEWLKKDLADKMFNNSVTWLKASLGITDPTKDLDIEEEPIK